MLEPFDIRSRGQYLHLSVSLRPPTARGELPAFHEMDPLRFQELCRDLYACESEFSNAAVYGTPGQKQRGIDVVAYPRSGVGLGVGQCKCVETTRLDEELISDASDEFFQELDYWRPRGVKRFVLCVAPEGSRTQIQEAVIKQRERFAAEGIDYELWDAATIAQKMRTQLGITRTYIGEHWAEILCGTPMPSLASSGRAVESVLAAQVETLAEYVVDASEAEVEALRAEWRKGKRQSLKAGIAKLREPGRWQTFSPVLRSKILRFEAQFALESNDLKTAKTLAAEAIALDEPGSVRIVALIKRAEGDWKGAVETLVGARETESQTLRAAILLEHDDVGAAMAILDGVAPEAETRRLRALGFVLRQDLAKARLEITKAIELEPSWEASRYNKLVIDYLSGISPVSLPDTLPQWPEPDDWKFIKIDDESRGYFAAAAAAAARLETETEAAEEQRRTYECWHLASLANDPERRSEAVAYCRKVLARDPLNHRAIIWAIARNLEVDLEPSIGLVQARLATGNAEVQDVVTLVALSLQRRDPQEGRRHLEEHRQLFLNSGNEILWRVWAAQVGLSVDSGGDAPPIPVDAELVYRKQDAKQSGSWNKIIEALRAELNKKDSPALRLELCSAFASAERWEEAAALAPQLVSEVGTAECLSLACVALHNSRQFAQCLQILESNRHFYPHGELPTQLHRVKVSAERELGLLPAATVDAEDLFRREPTRTHLRILADLYFEKGDFNALVLLARKHLQFMDLGVRELLQFAMRIADSERLVASELWRRAASLGVADEDVSVALEVAYKLALDSETAPLVRRLATLSQRPEGYVRAMNLDEVRQLLEDRRENHRRIYDLYRTGQIPVHFFAARANQPLPVLYHRLRLANETSDQPVAGPLFVRHGSRGNPVDTAGPRPHLRLHADLSALLLAAHLELLEVIEFAFRPIVIPHRTVVALAAMRNAMGGTQPARAGALGAVHELVSSGAIKPVVAATLWPLTDNGTVASAGDAFPLFVDFDRSASTGDTANDPPNLPTHARRSARSVIESLKAEGAITEATRINALKALGNEVEAPLGQLIGRGSEVLVVPAILELLAAGGVLQAAARTFRLNVDQVDFNIFVANELAAHKAGQSDANWMTVLMDRIARGIDSGVYLVMPDLDHGEHAGAVADDDSLEVRCFLDLLRYPVNESDAIWADDRFITGYIQRDGVPILGTGDVLQILRDRGHVNENQLLEVTHRLREGDFHFVAVGEEEIERRTSEAVIKNNLLIETRELKALRRHYARALTQAGTLRIRTDDTRQGSGLLEWPFLLVSGAAALNMIVKISCKSVGPLAEVWPRAEWILRNLYVPDRGRSFTGADRDVTVDRGLEALALSSLLTHALTVDAQGQARRDYLHWIFRRLIAKRFEADPALATVTLDALKRFLSESLDNISDHQEHRRSAAVIMRRLLADMPEALRERLTDDGNFVGRMGISPELVVRLGQRTVTSKELWAAAAQSFEKGESVILPTADGSLTVECDVEGQDEGIVVTDAVERRRYVLSTGGSIAVLSSATADREAAIRSIASSFDLPKANAEDAIARIAAEEQAWRRMQEVIRLRRNSAADTYHDLEQTIGARGPIDEGNFGFQNAEALLRHIRVQQNLESSSQIALNASGATLVEEVGLREAIVRLAGIPTVLPQPIVDAVAQLGVVGRHTLFKSLASSIATSPIGAAHVVRLLLLHRSDRPSYLRLARRIVRSLLTDAGQTHVEAWLAAIRRAANDLMYLEEFRQASSWVKIAVAWSHGDRLFRILANVGVSDEWIEQHFDDCGIRLPAEAAFADASYMKDIAFPRRLDPALVVLASAAYALEPDSQLLEQFRDLASGYALRMPRRTFALARDTSLAGNALQSIFSGGDNPPWLDMLTAEVRHQLQPETLRSEVDSALDRIRAGESSVRDWGVVHAVIGDSRVGPPLRTSLEQAITATDFVKLHSADKQTALLALSIAAGQAVGIGSAAAAHVRAAVLALAAVYSAAFPDGETGDQAKEMILSAAFQLFADSEESHGASRFAQIAPLLEELVVEWPALADSCQSFVDRLIEGLPTAHSRWLWQLQVKLRAGR